MKKQSCKICGGFGGLNKSFNHCLCEARKKRNRATPLIGNPSHCDRCDNTGSIINEKAMEAARGMIDPPPSVWDRLSDWCNCEVGKGTQ